MGKMSDLKNQIFGRLTVLEFTGMNHKRQSQWLCSCECGNELVVIGSYLKTGSTKSCGCYKRDAARERNPIKNAIEIHGEITKILIPDYMGNTFVCLIDTCMWNKVKRYRWYAKLSVTSGCYYVHAKEKTNGIRKILILHRIITDAPKGMVVDHINHDTLNNTLENLRVCTQRENLQNKKGLAKNNTTGARNVSWSKNHKKWKVKIGLDGKQHYLGLYSDKEEAIRVANENRKKLLPFAT